MFRNCKEKLILYIDCILSLILIFGLIYFNFICSTKICKMNNIAFNYSFTLVKIGFRLELTYIMLVVELFLLSYVVKKIKNR